ncbi:MAG: hypothetical protein LBC60_07055 [Spirochaetaceae bacterium]|jgi:hypothetical protein|nr:hypothetical protein [Spirochaetaceae bacterium]
MNAEEIQDELLRLDYPFLSPDHDPDIERYFDLINSRRSQDALILYQTRLKPRYPNDEFRALLMRCYRSRDPAYKRILAKAYQDLGERALERIKKAIIYIAEKVESYNERDVFSTIKAADEILLVLPKGHYEAQGGIERLFHYAEELDFYVKSMAKAVELIRSYLNQSLSVVEEAISRRENQRREELEKERRRRIQEDWKSYSKQKKQGHRVSRTRPMIDLSAIVFSEEDLARIEIPGNMTKPEDQTLAYCVKYWNLITDVTFEQMLYFYSKKYGTKHHIVYLAIRRGRLNKSRDDEILASVMSILVTGYYYSIRGDVYLQRKWNSIKPALQQHSSGGDALGPKTFVPRIVSKKARSRRISTPARSAKASMASPPSAFRRKPRKSLGAAVPKPSEAAGELAGPKLSGKAAAPAQVRSKTRTKAALNRPRTTPAKTRVKALPAHTKIRSKAVPVRAEKPARIKPVPVQAETPTRVKPVPAATPARSKPVPVQAETPARAKSVPAATPVRSKPVPVQTEPQVRAKPVSAEKLAAAQVSEKVPVQKEKKLPPSTRPIRRPSGPLRKPGGSVSDRLRELSGRSYDVYQDRFLSRARGAIRKVMGSGKRLFFTLPGAAEDLIYNFLKNHYSDPYMNWEESQEKKALEELGFTLDSLLPIIDECYRRL